MSNNGNVNITVNPAKPELPVFKQPQLFPNEIDYRDLASPGLSRQFVGKTVLFRAMYLADWNSPGIYKMCGTSVDNVIFINHRSIYYSPSMSPFGLSDSEIPPFPLSILPSQIGITRKLKRGDFVLIQGVVDQPDGVVIQPGIKVTLTIPDYCRIRVNITNIQALQSE